MPPPRSIYHYGADDLVAEANTVTATELQQTREILERVEGRVLPVRIVKAECKCNQIRWQDEMPCDWSVWIEAASDKIEARAKRAITLHLHNEHRGLEYRAEFIMTTVADLTR